MLPIFQSPDQNLMLLQTRWASQLNPILLNPILQGRFIPQVRLSVGDNAINHQLLRKPVGYIITDQTGAAQIYRSQPFSVTTLTLNSNAAIDIGLLVF